MDSEKYWRNIRIAFLCAMLCVCMNVYGLHANSDGPGRVLLPVVANQDYVADNLTSAIVFVSRKINDNGSIYWDAAKDQPGVGAHSRFRPAAPGKLIIREANGAIRVLVDGSRPAAASLNLIDVNAPDVSYDGKRIVFAGLPNGQYNTQPISHPGAWRLYVINVDGSGLRQLTKSDLNLNLASLNLPANLAGYDDGDPAWLPDGRIVFSSTRYPSFGQYSGVRTTNLFVVDANGNGMRRITSERNGADRPIVDPKTGRIVYARWWRNHRFAINDMSTIPDGAGGFVQKDGLTTKREVQITGESKYAELLWRNAWQIASINPDGTDVKMWSGVFRNEEANHTYGGVFTPDGDFISNFFPMYNMTEAAGFGGLRLYSRRGGMYQPLMGVTYVANSNYAYCPDPGNCSYGIYKSAYFTEPEALPNGKLIVSYARDQKQDYGLYLVNMDGKNLVRIYDAPGMSDVRARLVRPRPLPPVIADRITQMPSPMPPPADGPYDQDGKFVFNALNVYGNGPVDMDIVNAPAVGSAARIRFFIDHQRQSSGSFPNIDWPILLADMPVNPSGAVVNPNAPADVPLFEQIRTPENTVPLTSGPGGTSQNGSGAAHVAGMNYGRPGEVVRCVGCHAGHSMIPLPANDADALWSNVAPGADISVSSSRDPGQNGGVNDRRVMKGEIWRYWTSAPDQTQNQWVKLTFPVPVTVRQVRLYNPRQGDEAQSSLKVLGTQVVLFADAGATQQVGAQTSGPLSTSGTDVNFQDVRARVVLVNITGMSGTFYGQNVASIAEIEVIARAEAP